MTTYHSPASLVAIVDSSEEMTELLRLVLEDDGYRIATAYMADLRRGDPDPATFFAEHDPAATVWDIALPYEENWAFVASVRDGPAGQGRHFVLTTANVRALESLVGPTSAHEILGKPYDLDMFSAAVLRAVSG